MKILCVINGWKEAPHCWKSYLSSPFKVNKTPGWFSLSIFGITVFFDR